MAVLADKEQALARAVGVSHMPTHGTRLAGVVSIDSDCHTAMQEGFVSNHTLQFSKAPLGVGNIGFALLLARFLALLASSSLSPFI